MLERDDLATDLHAANRAVWACVVSPDGVDQDKFEQLTRVAAGMLDTEEGADVPDYHRRLNTAGAAYYRAGEFTEAVTKFEQSEQAYEEFIKKTGGNTSSRHEEGKIWNWLFLAMAQKQLNDLKEAEKFLDKAERIYGNRTPEQLARATGVPSPALSQRLALRLLLREARKEVRGEDGGSN